VPLLEGTRLKKSVEMTAATCGYNAPMAKRLWIETVGCQMNVLDSELVVAALRRSGWEIAATPATADAVFYNTCSVRQHAEDKI